jgi:DNA-binding NtrC family response regulator
MPSLLLLTGPSAGRRYELGAEAVLGRSPSCEIPLDDVKVSRRHAKVSIQDGRASITDLGSRNGTLVNGEKISAEVPLAPGDQIQVGDTTGLYDPPTKAVFAEREVQGISRVLIDHLLPKAGTEAALYQLSVQLLSAPSEARVLECVTEEIARDLQADQGAALIAQTEGLLTASVFGTKTAEVPRGLAQAALNQREVSMGSGSLCVPMIASGGAVVGLLYAEREKAFNEQERGLAVALGRIAGEALKAVRTRVGGRSSGSVLVGASKTFRKAVEDARRAAAGEGAVVVIGELGTGKTALAETIHGLSARALAPWIAVDCRQANVEEELFGKQSAPVGAPLPPGSALVRANGGTLLLKHVDSLAKSSAERLGRWISKNASGQQTDEDPLVIRFLATSVHSLTSLAQKGQFDPELARILSATEIEIAPLRTRSADVAPLFDHFAQAAAKLAHVAPPTLTPESRRLMASYAWPRNVREVRLVAEHLALLYPGAEIPATKLPPEIQQGSVEKPRSLDEMIATLEREAISEALREARGKKIRAAAILGISRPTLDKKIEDYGLVVQKVRGGSGRTTTQGA